MFHQDCQLNSSNHSVRLEDGPVAERAARFSSRSMCTRNFVMREKRTSVLPFCIIFVCITILYYCSVTGVFPASATIGTKSVKHFYGQDCWAECQVLADGVTPHGVTRMYSKSDGETRKLSEIFYWCGDQVEWIEFWPNGKIRAHSYEDYLAGPLRYKIFDEDGMLVQYY